MYSPISSSYTPYGRPSADKYERFEQWLRDNGAKFDMLELREYDTISSSSSSSMSRPSDEGGEEKKEPTTSSLYNSISGAAVGDLDDEIDNVGNNNNTASGESELRGVHAIRHIPPNQIIMTIPRRCLITVEMGQATPIGQAILQADLDLDAPKHIFLMIYILWDKKVNGKRSFFYPYYQVLPPTLHNMPIFWSERELSYLQGSHLLSQIHERNQAIVDDYRAICHVAPSLQQLCTLDEFKWARMCVCSRNFGLQMDNHRTSALVPHADMLNHRRPRETKWTFDEDQQAFTITSLQSLHAGAQVYDSYGQKCNHRFLLNYGFAVEDNRELDGFCPNEVPIELYVDPEDVLFAEKLDFWTRGEVGTSTVATQVSTINNNNSNNSTSWTKATPVIKRVRVCVSNNENTRLLFSLLRALVCDREELQAISTPMTPTSTVTTDTVARAFFGFGESLNTHHSTTSYFGTTSTTNTAAITNPTFHRSCRDIRHPISIRNERAAMRHLLEVISKQLALYPTSLAQDVADLRDLQAFPQFSNKRHAKIQVRGEKEVLHHFATWAQTSLDVLDVIEEELKEERGSVEVQLTSHGRTVTEERPGFDYIIRQMEDNVDTTVHHTVLRYCADVLGSLRREEFKNIRQQHHNIHHRPSSGRKFGYI